MADAWEAGISPHEFRKIYSKDLKAISRILMARKAKKEQMQQVYEAMANAK